MSNLPSSAIVKAVFAKHGIKVRVKQCRHSVRVCTTDGVPFDVDVALTPMLELNMRNALNEKKFSVNQSHESFLYCSQ